MPRVLVHMRDVTPSTGDGPPQLVEPPIGERHDRPRCRLASSPRAERDPAYDIDEKPPDFKRVHRVYDDGVSARALLENVRALIGFEVTMQVDVQVTRMSELRCEPAQLVSKMLELYVLHCRPEQAKC